jgi:hypothetical protein
MGDPLPEWRGPRCASWLTILNIYAAQTPLPQGGHMEFGAAENLARTAVYGAVLVLQHRVVDWQK